MNLWNFERKYAVGNGRFYVTFRGADGPIGPGGDATDLFLRDQRVIVGGRGRLVKHIQITGEERKEADDALRQLLDAMLALDAKELGEKHDVDHVFYRLTCELYDFCGFTTPAKPAGL